MKKFRLPLLCSLAILAGCAGNFPMPSSSTHGPGDALPTPSASLTAYKVAVANRIAAVNSEQMHTGRPQALLRSIVVVKYAVDGNGRLLLAEIMRSNNDRITESIALNTIRKSEPFPAPAAHLLQRGRLDLAETWLFNDDGRFQLRSTAQRQIDQ